MNRLAGLTIDLNPSPEMVSEWLNAKTPLACDVETPEQQQDVITLCGLAKSPSKGLVFDWKEPYVSLMRRWL